MRKHPLHRTHKPVESKPVGVMARPEPSFGLVYPMHPLNFCYWLRGYFELSLVDSFAPSQRQVVREHLDRVISRSSGSTSGAGGTVTIKGSAFKAPPPVQGPSRPTSLDFCEWLLERVGSVSVQEMKGYLEVVFTSTDGITITC